MSQSLPPYWIIHDSYTVLEVSDKVCDLFRCTKADLIGQDIFDIIPVTEMRALARWRMQHIREKGNLHSQDLPFKRPDGSVFWATVQTYKAGAGVFVSTLTKIRNENPDYHGT